MGIKAVYAGGRAFSVEVRGHQVLSDQKIEHGGEDQAPTPLEFMMVSLAACTALYAATYLRRHSIPHENLAVDTDWETASGPSRVSSIKMTLSGLGDLSDEDKAALLKAAERCMIKKTLEIPPKMEIVLA